MPRYIDADELCKDRVCNDPVRIAAMCAPTADVQEVKHGKWVRKIYCETYNGKRKREIYVCPFCVNRVFINENYCPNCGAKMDGKVNCSKENLIRRGK